MNYPQRLGLHRIPKYNYIPTFTKDRQDTFFSYAYYHVKDEYPLLMHCHDFYELNVVVSGEGRHYIENNSVKATPGCVFILPPNIMHGYYADGELELFHLALSDSFMNKFASELSSLPGYSTLFEIEPILRQRLNEELFLQLSKTELDAIIPELNQLVEYEHLDYAGLKTLKNARALTLIASLTLLVYQKNPTSATPSQPAMQNIVNGVEYIHKNYTEKIHLQSLADACFTSRATFARYFKRIFGVTPSAYITRLRIKHAKRLLRETELPVAQIALDSGFFDLSHFTRFFIRLEGTTPLKYRNENGAKFI